MENNSKEFVALIVDEDYYGRKDITVYGIYESEETALQALIKVIFTERITFKDFCRVKKDAAENIAYAIAENTVVEIRNYDLIFNEKIESEKDFIDIMLSKIDSEKSLEKYCDVLYSRYGRDWYIKIEETKQKIYNL